MNSPPLSLLHARRPVPKPRPMRPIMPPEVGVARAMAKLMGCEVDDFIPGPLRGPTRARAQAPAGGAAPGEPSAPEGAAPNGPGRRRGRLLRAVRRLEPLAWAQLGRLMRLTRAILYWPNR